MRARAFVYSSCRAPQVNTCRIGKGHSEEKEKRLSAESEVAARNSTPEKEQGIKEKSLSAEDGTRRECGRGLLNIRHAERADRYLPLSAKGIAKKRKKSLSAETNIRRRVGSRSAKLRAKASAANTCCICKGDDKAQAAVRRPKCAGDSPLRTKQKSSRKPLG